MRKTIIYLIVFMFFYIPFTLFTIPFQVTWGAKRNFLWEIHFWFITMPFDLNVSLWLIFLNSLTWAVFFLVLFKMVQGIINWLKV